MSNDATFVDVRTGQTMEPGDSIPSTAVLELREAFGNWFDSDGNMWILQSPEGGSVWKLHSRLVEVRQPPEPEPKPKPEPGWAIRCVYCGDHIANGVGRWPDGLTKEAKEYAAGRMLQHMIDDNGDRQHLFTWEAVKDYRIPRAEGVKG